MTYKFEVQTAGDGESWSSNAITYETEEAAEEAARDLMSRWTLVTDWRVREAEEVK